MGLANTHPQSLSRGGLGTALRLAVDAHTHPPAERALFEQVRRVGPVVQGEDAGLFYGAPALSLVLHLAPTGYGRALEQLDDITQTLTLTRLAGANQRMDRRELASFAEYDVLRGLAGLALLWLQRGTRPDLLVKVLAYLVRLSEPVTDDAGHRQAGWRVWHRPDAPRMPGPHTNHGLAHGICGPLAALALARRHGITVPGHDEAMQRILDHLDSVHRDDGTRCWWDRSDTGVWSTPPPPSWCYGSPGLVRAQQLAALALDAPDRSRHVERALLQHLSNLAPVMSAEPGICHGIAGILRVSERVAADSIAPAEFASHITVLRSLLAARAHPRRPGLLEGSDGVRLATAGSPVPWDTCLALI